MAEEIDAEIQTSVASLANRLLEARSRSVSISKAMRKKGILRAIKATKQGELKKCIGVASKSRSIGLGPLYLFGISVVSQTVELSEGAMTADAEDSTFRIDAIEHAAWKRRIQWLRDRAALDLLINALDEDATMVITDIPLTVSRQMETKLDFIDINTEWKQLLDAYKSFWQKAIERIFPFTDDGPIVISLSHGIPRTSVRRLFFGEGSEPACETMLTNTTDLIDLTAMLPQALSPLERTVLIGIDAFPSESQERNAPLGTLEHSVYYLRTTVKGGVMQIGLPGDPRSWEQGVVDRISGDIVTMTLPGVSGHLPFPLWLAKKKADFPKRVLSFAARRIRREMEAPRK